MSEDLEAQMRRAMEALSSPAASGARSITSDLTIDETLLLHGMGYEPTDLVTGVSVASIPYGTFLVQYGQGAPRELPAATSAVLEGFSAASERIRADCAKSGGVGIVGVDVDVDIGSASVTVALTGTGVRPIDQATAHAGRPFVTDLSVRDFALLLRAGWEPLDLVAGASFVAAPLQRLRQALSQAMQNVELTMLTQALQDARELAMDRMQTAALRAAAQGIVDVKIIDGPLGHAKHTLTFICWGTAVHLVADRHQRIEPLLVLPLDDNTGFEATALR